VGSLPEGSHWQVIGIGIDQWRLVAAAVGLGGNVRVGLEDNLYVEEGRMARSNGELVAKAAAMCHEQGRQVASAAEARQLLLLRSKP
jgi:3-keto-5-aminohexanoate cleavage enzyme